MKRPYNRKPVLDVELKLKCTGLVKVVVAVTGGVIAARTDTAHGKGPDGVGATYIELLAIRHFGRVAVSVGYTAEDS